MLTQEEKTKVGDILFECFVPNALYLIFVNDESKVAYEDVRKNAIESRFETSDHNYLICPLSSVEVEIVNGDFGFEEIHDNFSIKRVDNTQDPQVLLFLLDTVDFNDTNRVTNSIRLITKNTSLTTLIMSGKKAIHKENSYHIPPLERKQETAGCLSSHEYVSPHGRYGHSGCSCK